MYCRAVPSTGVRQKGAQKRAERAEDRQIRAAERTQIRAEKARANELERASAEAHYQVALEEGRGMANRYLDNLTDEERAKVNYVQVQPARRKRFVGIPYGEPYVDFKVKKKWFA